jgi:hypothetical protein
VVVVAVVADLVLQSQVDFSGEVLPMADLAVAEVVLAEALVAEADLVVSVAEALVAVVLAEAGKQLPIIKTSFKIHFTTLITSSF